MRITLRATKIRNPPAGVSERSSGVYARRRERRMLVHAFRVVNLPKIDPSPAP
jgi:hypothetical protein